MTKLCSSHKKISVKKFSHQTVLVVTTVTTVTTFTTVTTVTTVTAVTTIIVKYQMLLLYSSKGNFFTKFTDQQTGPSDQPTTGLLELLRLRATKNCKVVELVGEGLSSIGLPYLVSPLLPFFFPYFSFLPPPFFCFI